MKIENYQFPKSSFLSVEKDYSLLIQKLLKSERLKKLLYYTTKDALEKPALTQAQQLELIEKNIRLVPKYYINNEIPIYIIISFDQFEPGENPEFRDNLIVIDIVCHVEQWALKDFQLRPFKIAGEIDSILDGAKLTGIGKVDFATCNQVTINSDFISLCLVYTTVHGEDDAKHPVNPQEEQRIIDEFNKAYND